MKTINVTVSSMPPIEEYIQEISDIWESRWLTHTGPKHQKLEQELCRFLRISNMALFANGHLALEAAFSILPKEGEVITTPFTFASTTQAIVHCGLTPVFCDIEPDHFTMDVEKIEALITERTCAIAPVHVYGNICNFKKIGELAVKYGLKVIYDAAHAFGETIDGRAVGSLGDISMFSFHATKVFHTVEGGGLAYHDEKLTREFAAWRQFGMYGKEDAEKLGTNAKMTEFHAAMGICNLHHVDEQISLRKQATMRYRERLVDILGLKLCPEQSEVKHNYAYLPVLFDPKAFGFSRDEVAKRLEENGIFARKYFYPLTSDFAVYQSMFEIQQTPIAKDIAERILTLPLYAGLTEKDVDRVCDVVLRGGAM